MIKYEGDKIKRIQTSSQTKKTRRNNFDLLVEEATLVFQEEFVVWEFHLQWKS
jgi:hypothetical protein